MNYIQNDRGEYVPAVGAEGSDARLKAQFPRAIKEIKIALRNGLYSLESLNIFPPETLRYQSPEIKSRVIWLAQEAE